MIRPGFCDRVATFEASFFRENMGSMVPIWISNKKIYGLKVCSGEQLNAILKKNRNAP